MAACRAGEHTWRTGPLTDLLLRTIPVICIDCLDMDKVAYEASKSWPKWTEEDATRLSSRIEERYG